MCFGAFRKLVIAKTKCASLHYGLCSQAFDREFRVVREGVKKYRHELAGEGSHRTLIRRDTHRIEKGLTMKPRRDIFAADYIEELVRVFTVQVERGGYTSACRGEAAWCADVLREYFDVTKSNPARDRAKERFEQIEHLLPEVQAKVPYRRDLSVPSPVGYDELLALSERRRSVRWFLDKRVERELINKAMMVARQSPSACNRQPFVFHVFDDVEMVRKVASVPMGTAGYEHQIPCIIVVVGQLRNYFDERDRHLIYIDGALAGMSFVFALETLGLSSCIINWPDIEQKELEMAKLIGLEDDERPVFLIAVGYPDPAELVAFSDKKSVDELITYGSK